MFSNISEIVTSATKDTDEALSSKKKRYEKARSIILGFCRKNNLFIQKNYLGRGLLNVIAYSRDPLRHANNLTNLLDQESKDTHFDGYIVLKSLIAKEKFAIDVDSYRMIIIKRISNDLDKLLLTYITGDEKWIPPELEMIDLFQRIYNPYSEMNMKDIVDHIDLNLEKIKAIEGGEEKSFLDANSEVFKTSRFILLGDHAWDAITTKSKKTKGDVVTFISDYPPKDTIDRLQNMTTEAYNFREYDLMLPSDGNLKKYALTHMGKTVAIFYNSTRYELVPYIEVDGVKCGTAPVLLRFYYVDLYVFRIIQLRQGLDDKGVESMMYRTKKSIQRVIAHKDESVYFSNTWFGTLRNEIVENTKKMLSAPERYYPYYPRAYKEGKGDYRKI